MVNARKLNVGAGTKPLPGYENIDKFVLGNEFGVLRGDIEEGLDYPSESFDEILLDNVIEHLDDIPRALREIHRLLKPGGICRIVTPHFTSKSSWVDPTHRFHLSYFSLDYFISGTRENYMDVNFCALNKKLSFPGGILGVTGRLIFSLSPKAWETSWCFIFRASTLRFVLTK